MLSHVVRQQELTNTIVRHRAAPIPIVHLDLGLVLVARRVEGGAGKIFANQESRQVVAEVFCRDKRVVVATAYLPPPPAT